MGNGGSVPLNNAFVGFSLHPPCSFYMSTHVILTWVNVPTPSPNASRSYRTAIQSGLQYIPVFVTFAFRTYDIHRGINPTAVSRHSLIIFSTWLKKKENKISFTPFRKWIYVHLTFLGTREDELYYILISRGFRKYWSFIIILGGFSLIHR